MGLETSNQFTKSVQQYKPAQKNPVYNFYLVLQINWYDIYISSV